MYAKHHAINTSLVLLSKFFQILSNRIISINRTWFYKNILKSMLLLLIIHVIMDVSFAKNSI